MNYKTKKMELLLKMAVHLLHCRKLQLANPRRKLQNGSEIDILLDELINQGEKWFMEDCKEFISEDIIDEHIQ